jgi:hypothetical protein
MRTIDWATVGLKLGHESETVMWQSLYWEQKLSITTLATRFGVSKQAVRAALLRCSIKLRERGGPQPAGPDPGPIDLEAQVAKDGVTAVSKRLGLSPSAVYKRLYRRRHLRLVQEGKKEA